MPKEGFPQDLTGMQEQFGEAEFNSISVKNKIAQWFVIGGLAILSDNKGGTLELAFLKIVC